MIIRYAIATLVPAVLILAGALFGGYLPLLALLWLTVVAGIADLVLPAPASAPAEAEWADHLTAGLGAVHLLLIPVVLLGLSNPNLSAGAQLALFLAAASFMGQVSHPNAHELIHRAEPRLRNLGIAVYSSLLYGHHVTAHRFIHHIHVGTKGDPSTPEPGEGFWTYAPRAWVENFLDGFEVETARLRAKGQSPWSPQNPYAIYMGGAFLTLLLAAIIGGVLGVITYLALVVLVHLQMLLSDYIQHYGLQRLALPDGSIEPIAPHHSWNAPGGFSTLLMLNAPRHGEHHLNAARPFQDLAPAAKPMLPHAMPIMAIIALVPDAWRGLMDKRALAVMEAAQSRLGVTPEPIRPGEVGDLRRALRA